MAPIGFNIAAKGGYFVWYALPNQRYSAMLQPCWHHLEPMTNTQLRDCFWPCIATDINICHRLAHQRVSHATAHQQGLITGLFQHGAQALQPGCLYPAIGDLHRLASAAPSRAKCAPLHPKCNRAPKAPQNNGVSFRASAV